jgi:hypothetical protein
MLNLLTLTVFRTLPCFPNVLGSLCRWGRAASLTFTLFHSSNALRLFVAVFGHDCIFVGKSVRVVGRPLHCKGSIRLQVCELIAEVQLSDPYSDHF